MTHPLPFRSPPAGPTLAAYLLGALNFDTLQHLQRRLVYDVSAGTGDGALILCELPPGVTVGRDGSRNHIRLTPEDLTAREWPVRWVARGGGVMPHGPGQVCCFPVVHLPSAGLTPAAFVRKLCFAVADALTCSRVVAEPVDDPPGVVAGGRRIAQVGVAVRQHTTCFGAAVNVCPDLELFRRIDPDGDPHPLTSVQRESPLPARVPAVRQALLQALAERLGFSRTSVFHTHPALVPHAPAVRRHGS